VSVAATAESGSAGSRRIWIVGLLTLGVLTALIGFDPIWNTRLQSFWFDAFQRYVPRKVETTPAMVVEIDEKSLAAYGQWPWPRTLLAELIRDIEQYQPLAIGVDILMPEADRLSPQQLLVRARMGVRAELC
jgi:adenylate cyclase